MTNQSDFLNSQPPYIKKLDNGAEYIPIGVIETDLDNFTNFNWGAYDFKFQVIQINNYYFADASVTLYIDIDGVRRTMQGAATLPISFNDENKDYSATCLSFCIANAAKRLAQRFGRGLNGRLQKGETAALPVTQLREKNNEDDEIDKELKVVTALVQRAETKEEALDIMKRTGFGFNVQMKEIANNKPSKKTA